MTDWLAKRKPVLLVLAGLVFYFALLTCISFLRAPEEAEPSRVLGPAIIGTLALTGIVALRFVGKRANDSLHQAKQNEAKDAANPARSTKKLAKLRSSNLELLRIICVLSIIGDHFTGQSGIVEGGSLLTSFFYCSTTSLSRVACLVFVIISAWFSVDQGFRFRKIVHVWLTVIMYTLPITIWLFFSGIASQTDLIVALYPVEASPLWFAGYYIVLVLLSPILNLFLRKAPKHFVTYFLVVFLCLQGLFNTITTSAGFFANDLWPMLFVYILTGYIKKYCLDKVPDGKHSLLAFFALWFLLTFLRAFATEKGLSIIAQYCEVYRARLQSIPNMLMAYTMFFTFLKIKMKPSRTITLLASTSLGVYCFHQVPVWYAYLWKTGFKSDYYSANLHGGSRMIYTMASILIVWLCGVLVELVRNWISRMLIEDRAYYKSFCERIDACICTEEDLVAGDERKKLRRFVILAVAIYFGIVQALTFYLNYNAKQVSFVKPTYSYGTELRFTKGGMQSSQMYVVSGLSDAEDEFTWSCENVVEMVFYVRPTENDIALTYSCDCLPRTEQRVFLSVDGQEIENYTVSGMETKTAVIPAELAQDGSLNVRFELPDAISPKDLGVSQDDRKLSLAFYSMSLSEQM